MKNTKWVIWLFLWNIVFSSQFLFAADTPRVIRIGLGGSGYAKVYTAGVFGYIRDHNLLEDEFKADGIQIEWTFFPGIGPELNTAFASKTIDFSTYGDFPAIIGKAAGTNTVALAVSGRDSQIWIAVPAKSTAKSIEDLKGKTVGIYFGGYHRLIWARKLESLGLTEKDFNLVNIRPADGAPALVSGRLDAYVGSSTLLILKNQGTAKIIYDSKSEPPDWRGIGLLQVTESFRNKYPDVTKRFLKKYLEAVCWRSDEKNREVALEMDARGGTPIEVLREAYSGITFKDLYDPRFDDTFVSHYKNAIEYSKKNKWINKDIDIEKWIDRPLLDQALKEVNWGN
jgi:sulfonate transport system substrate-binding protein